MAGPKNRMLAIADVQVKQEDVVAIRIAAFERELVQQQTLSEKRLSDLRKQHSELNKSCAEAVEAASQNVVDLSGVTKELKKLGINVEVQVTGSMHGDSTKRELGVHVRMMARRRNAGEGDADINFDKRIPLPAAIKKQQEQLSEICKDIQKELELQVDIRRKLSNIPMVERQTRAAIAKQTLEGSEGGREMLKMLDTLKPLPGLETGKTINIG